MCLGGVNRIEDRADDGAQAGPRHKVCLRHRVSHGPRREGPLSRTGAMAETDQEAVAVQALGETVFQLVPASATVRNMIVSMVFHRDGRCGNIVLDSSLYSKGLLVPIDPVTRDHIDWARDNLRFDNWDVALGCGILPS